MAYYLRFDLFDRSTVSETKVPHFNDIKVSCTHFGRNSLWIGDLDGMIYRYDREFSSTMFPGYEKCVNLIYQVKDRDVLITAGIDTAIGDIIKIWNWSKWNDQNIPSIILKINCGSYSEQEFKISCFNALTNLNAMVIGLATGNIEIIYSNILLSKKSKRKQIFNHQERVTNLAIYEEKSVFYIFSTTAEKIYVMTFNENTNDFQLRFNANDFGCPLNCSQLVDNEFVILNQSGIYDVFLDDKGKCTPLDGDKIGLYLYKHYFVVVKLFNPSVVSGTHLAKTADQRSQSVNYQVIIIDRVNRFISGEFIIPDFKFLFVEWGSIYIYSGGHSANKVFVLTEKDIQSRLKIMFQRNSFKFAIEIAKSQNFDEDDLADMFRQYGDHLYRQKNYDEAIQAYIKTIGRLEPSFVIEKFLNPSQILNLTKYMEALVEKLDSVGEHTVLLINCYVISKDQAKLMSFIKNHKSVDFNVDMVMNLLRKVQMFDEALELAKRYTRHDLYLKALIEDLKSYKDAILYIETLDAIEKEEALLTHGDTLINIEPEVIAKQLESVCDKQHDSKLNINTILKVFVNNREGLKHFLQSYVMKNGERKRSIYVDTLLELLLYDMEKYPSNSEETAAKVMEILKSENLKYSRSKALVLCQSRKFKTGYRYLCELQKDYAEIINSYKSENDVKGVLETCQRFGSEHSDLWIKALDYLIEKNAKEEDFNHVISQIEKNKLMSPLLLLEKMSKGPNDFQFGIVKDFIMKQYEANEKAIMAYQNEITKLKAETQKNYDAINGLNTEVQVFQNLKCQVCSNTLDIPSVHFLCGHSYHQRCFETYTSYNEECPNCSPNFENLLSEINQWQSEKFTSLPSTNSLSLEKLWINIISHADPRDVDNFISDTLVESLKNETKFRAESNVSTKSTPSSESVLTNNLTPVTRTVVLSSVPVVSKVAEKSATMQTTSIPSSLRSNRTFSDIVNPIPIPSSSLKSQQLTNLNPFDEYVQPKSTNPFDMKPEEELVNSDDKNPFGNFLNTEDFKQTKNSNPFQ